MDELQCEDLYIPAFLLRLPPKKDFNGNEEKEVDFLNNIEAWAGFDSEQDHDDE